MSVNLFISESFTCKDMCLLFQCSWHSVSAVHKGGIMALHRREGESHRQTPVRKRKCRAADIYEASYIS